MTRIFVAAIAICFAAPSAAQVILTEGTNISVDAAADGRLATDLLGELWLVPADGGDAERLGGARSAAAPRWSPTGNALVYSAPSSGRATIWLYELGSETHRLLSGERWYDRHPDWHPDGDRIVFSSARHGAGFDIWEMDLETRLSWRLTRLPGNESEPAWSADGRDLVFVHEHEDRWSIVLKRRDAGSEVLVTSSQPLAAPSWRPDGSLVTYLRRDGSAWSIAMVILSEPRLERTLIGGEDFFLSPVSWIDRQQLVYASNGHLNKRRFNAWSSDIIPFRAAVANPGSAVASAPRFATLAPIDEPNGRSIIRAARLYDGLGANYRDNVDIVIDRGTISAIEPTADRPGEIVIDLGDITALPGYIDAYARLPHDVEIADGPLLLGLGVTTLLAAGIDRELHNRLNAAWSGKTVPGPRVLGGDWRDALESGFAALPGNQTMPTSPAGIRYEDAAVSAGSLANVWLSGLADASTPGIDEIWQSRQARHLSAPVPMAHRFAETPEIGPIASGVVVASRPGGLPPGIGLHAELRALAAAGVNNADVLRAAGTRAAAALDLGRAVGRVSVGSAADLVLVDGDPLVDIDDTLKIVGIVRNGRFFSVSGLIDRAATAKTVE